MSASIYPKLFSPTTCVIHPVSLEIETDSTVMKEITECVLKILAIAGSFLVAGAFLVILFKGFHDSSLGQACIKGFIEGLNSPCCCTM